MTTKILSGTYPAGYTLSNKYTALSITSTGFITGPAGPTYSYGGGTGLTLTFAAPVVNAGSLIAGGAGYRGQPSGGMTVGGPGGAGGLGVDLAAGGSFTSSGEVLGGSGGAGGAAFGGGHGGGGGGAINLRAAGVVANSQTIAGGHGGPGGFGTYGGGGGAGAVAISFAAGGSVSNTGDILGGAGAAGGNSTTNILGKGSPGAGGAGGAAIAMTLAGTVTNGGSIVGGAGGAAGTGGAIYSAHGVGGAGAALAGGGTVTNTGTIIAGDGGYKASGGDGITLGAAGVVSTSGVIRGGAGGYQATGGYGIYLAASGSVANHGAIYGGDDNYGTAGTGVALQAGGTLSNFGLIQGGGSSTIGSGGLGVFVDGGSIYNAGAIRGGADPASDVYAFYGYGAVLFSGRLTNGGASDKIATIFGQIGVDTGSAGAVTVVNFGTLQGAFASVYLRNAADRLIAEAGAVFSGRVHGGGALELAGGAETISGLGGPTVTMTGSTAMTFAGFATYQVDAAATLALTGTNTLAASGTLIAHGQLSLAPGAGLTVNNGAVAQIQGAVANAGAISLVGGAALSDLRVLSPGATLTGGGTVHLLGAKSRILGTTASATLTNVDNTIAGIGFIGLNQMTLINEAAGVIDANGAGSLVVKTKGELLTNGGLMEATAGGLLVIATTTVANAGGAILAADGSHIDLETVVVRGGAVGSAGTGAVVVNVAGGELDGGAGTVTLSGLVEVLNGSNEILNGAIANTGRLNTFAGSKNADLIIGPAGATLTGKGTVNLDNSALNRIFGQTASDTLTNVDNHIDGAGLLGNGVMTLVNQGAGVIVGNQTHALTIDTGANTIVNAGVIENVGSGGTTIKSAVDNTGSLIVTKGVLTVTGAVTGTGAVKIAGGTADFASTFTENVAFTSTAGVLELAHSSSYAGHVTGFSKTGTTSLDLLDIAFASGTTKASYSGTTTSGVLTVTDGTHTAHIHLTGDYTASTFVVATDGHGGTLIHDPPKGQLSSPVATFVAAMAGLGPSAAPSPALEARGWREASPRLAAPGGHPS